MLLTNNYNMGKYNYPISNLMSIRTVAISNLPTNCDKKILLPIIKQTKFELDLEKYQKKYIKFTNN